MDKFLADLSGTRQDYSVSYSENGTVISVPMDVDQDTKEVDLTITQTAGKNGGFLTSLKVSGRGRIVELGFVFPIKK